MKHSENSPATQKPSTKDAEETKYIKIGVVVATVVMLIAFNVYLDEVYNDGVSSSVPAKVKRFFTKKNYDKWQTVPLDTSKNIDKMELDSLK